MIIEPTKIAAGGGMLLSAAIVAYGIATVWSHSPAAPTAAAPIAAAAPTDLGVWAAARMIPRGQRITAADLVWLPLQGKLPAKAITQLDAAVGRIVVADVPPYAVLLADRITSDPAKAGLALTIPVGYRAVALRTNDEIAVSDFIRPGDHVDLELILRESVLPKQTDNQEHADGNPSEARTLLQDVTVITVGETLSAEENAGTGSTVSARRPEPPHTVTLAMTPDQVSQFMLARSLGTLYLSLRNPSDLQSVRATTVRLDDIRGPTAPSAAPVGQGKRPIELITGNKSQTIYSAEPAGSR